jgi:hypothetical protein
MIWLGKGTFTIDGFIDLFMTVGMAGLGKRLR